MTTSITIATDLLAAVAKWAGTDESPAHLELVVFRNDEVVACDGHRMVRVPLRTHGLELAVHRTHLLAAVAAQKELSHVTLRDGDSNRAVALAVDSAGRLSINLGLIIMSVPAGALATYPPIDQATPTPQSEQPPSPDGYVFNPQYLSAIDEVNRAMGDGPYGVKCVAWSSPQGSRGMRTAMRFDNRSGARFVVMPMTDTIGDGK